MNVPQEIIEKGRLAAEKASKECRYAFEGMTDEEIEECLGLVVDSNPDELKKHILEWWESEGKIHRSK